MEEYRTRLLLLLADIDQSKKVPLLPTLQSLHKALLLRFMVQSVSILCDLLY